MTSMIILTNIVSIFLPNSNTFIEQYYLPTKNQVNKDFLRLVFADKKRLFKKKQIDFIHVPHWDELSVKNMWKDLQKDKSFTLYF